MAALRPTARLVTIRDEAVAEHLPGLLDQDVVAAHERYRHAHLTRHEGIDPHLVQRLAVHRERVEGEVVRQHARDFRRWRGRR